jgi:HlyD family secretion protein
MISRISKKALAGGVGLALIGLASFLWLSRPQALRTASIEKDVPVRVFGLGTMEARVVSRIGFEVGAAITELAADHGDLVKKNAPLARLHATEQEAKIAKAKADLLSAQVGIVKAEANVQKAQSVLTQKQEANRRKQSLVDRRVVSEQSAEEALRDEEVAKADLAVAKAEVEVAKAKVADATAQLDLEQTLLEHHTLVAPFDALVVERHKETGTVIKAGDPIYTLVAPETVWVLAHVDESRSGAITEGQAAEIKLRSMPQRSFKGRVARIGIESDRVTEERKVYVTCEDCPSRIHLGEQAEVLITVARIAEALMVPEASTRALDGRHATVWTIENGRLAERRVAIGHRTDDARVQITEELPKGSQIAIGVPAHATAGRAVRAASAEPRK